MTKEEKQAKEGKTLPYIKRVTTGKVVETKLMYKGKSTLKKECFLEKVLNFFKRNGIF